MRLLPFILALPCLALAGPAWGADYTLDCKPPRGFAGEAATVSGEISKTGETKDGNEVVVGSLAVSIGGSAAKPTLKKKDLKVKGALLADGALYVLGEKDVVIYVNLVRRDVSHVEYRGNFYKMECAKK